jgi:hypothetical protein
LYNELDTARDRKSHISQKIKEILKLQLEPLGDIAVFHSIIKSAEETYKCGTLSLNKDVFLIENLVKRLFK